MSRIPQVNEEIYASLVKEAESRGFDTKKLMRTTCGTAPKIEMRE
jgi:lipocalin